MKKFVVVVAALLMSVVRCQETAIDDETSVVNGDERSEKEKRGISLNLGSGLEGYNYLGPASYSRGYNRGYPSGGFAPMTDYGYDGVSYGVGGQNFASGFQSGYNSPYGNYPYGYRGSGGAGYPTSYSHIRQYNSPVSTYPLGGIGTVGPIGGGAYGGLNGGGGLNRFGYDNYQGGGYQGGYQGGFY